MGGVDLHGRFRHREGDAHARNMIDPEGLAALGVVEAQLQCPAGQPHGPGGVVETAGGHTGQRDGETLAEFAEDHLRADPDIVEIQKGLVPSGDC